LNDANVHAVNFYRWAATGFTGTLRMENDEHLYYRHRDRFNALTRRGRHETQEAAELFYFLNRTGYNGLCRFNRKGEFNVPFGRYTTINYLRDFSPYRALARWQFATGDFESVPLESGDFVYADPPYDVQFRQYSSGGFEWADQVRLAEWLSRHDGPVVLSNQATERITELYLSVGFQLRFFDAPRRISCTGDRTPAREVLALRGF
jgi:DNA adenine methylase